MENHVAYIAGIIDGEGTITLARLRKSAKYRYPVVSVSSTTLEILEYLKQHYGGSISKQKVYQDHHKQSWSWKLQGNKALVICADILPMLIEPSKKYRALLLLQQYKQVTPRNGWYTSEMHEAKLAFEHLFFHPSTS